MNTKLKYRDILESLAKMSRKELEQDAVIHLTGNGENFPMEGLEKWCPKQMDSDALDEGHWFFWAIA